MSRGQVRLVELRAPLKKYEWNGDWSARSTKWTPDILEQIRRQDEAFNEEIGIQSPGFVRDGQNGSANMRNAKQRGGVVVPSMDPDDENNFWMSLESIMQRFTCLNVCKAVNMDEIRIRGKFLRVQDIDMP